MTQPLNLVFQSEFVIDSKFWKCDRYKHGSKTTENLLKVSPLIVSFKLLSCTYKFRSKYCNSRLLYIISWLWKIKYLDFINNIFQYLPTLKFTILSPSLKGWPSLPSHISISLCWTLMLSEHHFHKNKGCFSLKNNYSLKAKHTMIKTNSAKVRC